MVSNFGIQLANGYHHVHHRHHLHPMHHHGAGTVRKIAGNVLGSLGHMLITRVAKAISGTGHRRTYRKRRTTHTVRGSSWKVVGTGGYRRKTYRRRLIGTGRRTTRTTYHRRHTTTGGYKRVRRQRTRRIGAVRRHHRILII